MAKKTMNLNSFYCFEVQNSLPLNLSSMSDLPNGMGAAQLSDPASRMEQSPACRPRQHRDSSSWKKETCSGLTEAEQDSHSRGAWSKWGPSPQRKAFSEIYTMLSLFTENNTWFWE